MTEDRAKRKKSKLWMLVLPTIIGGVVLFFVLPFLETPRRLVMGMFGINPGREESKSISAVPEIPCPGPFEVSADIENAPLLQRDEVAKQYVGIQVDWTGKLSNIDKLDADRLDLQVCVTRSWVGTVCYFAEIKSVDYPGIGLLKAGDRIRMQAYIKDAHPGRINLRDAKIIR